MHGLSFQQALWSCWLPTHRPDPDHGQQEMYMYIYIYTYIHASTIYIYIYIHTLYVCVYRCVCIYIYIYICSLSFFLSLYIHICIYTIIFNLIASVSSSGVLHRLTERLQFSHAARCFHSILYHVSYMHVRESTPSLPTNIVDLRGFDSSIILILWAGILMSTGNFLESLSQAILVVAMLVGRLGVQYCTEYRSESGMRGTHARAVVESPGA